MSGMYQGFKSRNEFTHMIQVSEILSSPHLNDGGSTLPGTVSYRHYYIKMSTFIAELTVKVIIIIIITITEHILT